MRKFGVTLMTAALVLSACGGEKKADEAATPAPAPAPEAAAPAAPAAPAGAAASAPATGKTVEVKMIGDDKGYRFEPADVTVAAGDAIKFLLVTGGPHNVAFDPAKIPADVKAQLNANIPEKLGELSSAMKINPGESVTISFAGIKPGTYEYFCAPHLAMGMKGKITVN